MPPSLLPFLYPAGRVAGRGVLTVPRREFLRSLHGSIRQQYGDQQPEGTEGTERPMMRPPRGPPLHHDPIPFDLPADVAEQLDRERVAAAERADEGTVTPLERRAFRRIFKEISTTRARQEDGAAGDEDMPSLRMRVNAIVDEAADDVMRARGGRQAAAAEEVRWDVEDELLESDLLQEKAHQDDSPRARRQAILDQFPASLRAAAGAALGIKEAERGVAEARDNNEEIHDSFSLLSNDNSHPPLSGHRDPRDTPMLTPQDEARQARQARMELLMLSKKTDFALWDYMEAHVFALAGEFGLTGRRASAKSQQALAAYAPLYPALLLHGVRLLDGRFGGSPLALAVLPRVKALGLASYVLGAGTPLYNAQLAMRWGRRGDAVAALRLLAEMQRAGLAFDTATLAVVRSMEFHLVGGVGVAEPAAPRAGPRAPEGSFAAVAARQLSGSAGLAEQLQYWRRQVERAVRGREAGRRTEY
ncbi:hypothetical protein CMQ_1128 [Grosmannia clavigera kw1407]|uniref:Mtf2-like C-terminal domain-containing protein n=1 Tax=Grosmannia clavigera (strain kw1407 / UAMH 11150) TaxID=655863 RepID=F0XEW6_GROCL|nr:uncharacterized protein CMQ_1128 [Grosmannia clavigera kw1407]EFX04200.1 hypothetical protein CMQ_1128 [Grosmannia clavigera kw1407]